MPTIRANDLDIGYEVRGAGEPLVILHGAGTTAGYTFRRQLPGADGRVPGDPARCARPRRRRAGTSADGFRAEWLVDDLEAFVDALGLGTFHLIGYSMGGMTALGFAVRRPERLRTLMVAGITTSREPRASVVRRLMDPARIERDEPEWAADLAPPRRRRRATGRAPGSALVTAVAADVASQPLLTPARDPRHHRPDARHVRRSRPAGARRPGRRPRAARSATGACSWHRAPATTSPTSDRKRARRSCWTSIDRPKPWRWLEPRPPTRPRRTGGCRMTTLLALYRRPEGGPDAQATFERRYAEEHLPLVAGTPGLRETRVQRVVEALGQETDLIIATTMRFDDRAALDAGLTLGRDAGGRPEPARDRAGSGDAVRARGPAGHDRRRFPGCGYCLNARRGAFVDRHRADERHARDSRRRDRSAARPRRVPGARSRVGRPGDGARRRRARDARPPGHAQRAQLRPARPAGGRARDARRRPGAAAPSSSPGRGRARSPPGPTSASSSRRRPPRSPPADGSARGTASRRSGCRSSRRSAASRSAAAASSRWSAT